MMGLFAALTFLRHSFALLRLRSTGFSQRTALPAKDAFSIKSECVSVEVAINIASTLGSEIISSLDFKAAPYCTASSLAEPLSMSETA